MFQRIVENIAAKILQRVAGGCLAFWRWPNVSRLFSALSFLAVLGLGACNDLSMPDPSDGVAAGQAYIVVKNTTAEELLIGLDENADDQGALNDERRTLSVGAEEEFEVEIPGDSRKVWLKLPGYAAEPIKLRSKDYKERTADRVYSCVNMEFSSYTTSDKGIKIVPDDPEKIAGSSVVYPDEEGGCPAFAQNLITSTANAAGENEFSIEDGTRGQEIIKEFSIVIRADYEAKVRFEKLDDLIGFGYQSDKSLVDLTKDGEALELQMTEDPHEFVQENKLPELNFVDGTAAEISFDDKEKWIPLHDIDTPTSQKFEVEYSDADGDELGYFLMANVEAWENGSLLPKTEEIVEENDYKEDPSRTHELKLYSPVKGKSEIANMSRDQRHRVEVTARVDDGMKDGRGKAEVTRTLYVNVAPEIEALQFGDGTDVSDIVETEKDNWLQLDSGDKTSFSVAARDADDGADLTYSWKVNNEKQQDKKTATVELDLGSTGAHEVEVAVTVSDGAEEKDSQARTLYVNVKPTQPTGIEVKERGQLVPGESARNYTLELVGGMDPDGDQLEYEWEYVGPTTDNIVFNPRDLVKSLEYSKIVTVKLPLGPHKIRARLKDKYGGKGEWFEEEITVGNHAPTITELKFADDKLVKNIDENNKDDWLQLDSGEKTSLTVEAADLDGDDLTYSWTVNGGDKKVTTDPRATLDLGSLAENHKVVVAVTVSDGVVDSKPFMRTLYVNVAPKIDEIKIKKDNTQEVLKKDQDIYTKDKPLQLDSGEKTSFSVAATDADDGADLSYTWTVNGEEQQDKKTATLVLDLGSLAKDHKVVVAVTASDGNGDKGKDTIERTLYVNVAPEIKTLKFGNGTDVSDIGENNKDDWLQLNSGDKTSFSVVATDADDGDDLTYSWTVNGKAPQEKDMQVTKTSTGETVELDLGSLAENHKVVVAVSVSDGVTEVPKTRTLYVNVAPKIDEIKIKKDNTQEVLKKGQDIYTKDNPLQLDSGEKTSFSVAATDADDGADLTYSWKVNNEEQQDKKTATVELDLSSTGDHKVVVAVTVSDGAEEKDSQARTLYVNVAPTPTEIKATPGKLVEKNPGSLARKYTLALVGGTDPDGDQLEYEWEYVGPTTDKIVFTPENSRNVTVILPLNQTHIIRARLKDEHGAEGEWFEEKITVENHAPRIIDENIKYRKGGYRYEVLGDDKYTQASPLRLTEEQKWKVELFVAPTDDDGDDLSYSWTVNGKAPQEQGMQVRKERSSEILEMDLGSLAGKHEVVVEVSVSDGVLDSKPFMRTLYVDVEPVITYLSGEDSKWADEANDYKSWIQFPASHMDEVDSGVAKEFTVEARDLDGDALDFILMINMKASEKKGKPIVVRDSPMNERESIYKDKETIVLYSPMNERKSIRTNYKDEYEEDEEKKRHKLVVTAVARDGTLVKHKSRTLYVNVAPTQPTEIKATADKLVSGESEWKYTLELVGGMDPDGDQLEYEWEYVGPTTDNIVFNPRYLMKSLGDSRIVTVNLPSGKHTIRARLKDEYGGKGKWFEEEITVGNHAPTITSLSGEDSVWDDEANNYKSWIQLDALDSPETEKFAVVAEDLDGDNLTYTWTVNGETPQTKDIQVTKKLTGETVKLQLYSPVKDKTEDQIKNMSAEERHKVEVAVTVSDGATRKRFQRANAVRECEADEARDTI